MGSALTEDRGAGSVLGARSFALPFANAIPASFFRVEDGIIRRIDCMIEMMDRAK